jgi:hypothetical protein
MSSNWVLGVFKQVCMTFEHLNEIYEKYFMIKEQTASWITLKVYEI